LARYVFTSLVVSNVPCLLTRSGGALGGRLNRTIRGWRLINGRHNVKLGLDMNRTFVSQDFRGNWRGLYLFTSLENYLRVADRQVNPATGRPYPADFLRIFFGNGRFRDSFWDFAGFLQDSIRLTPRLSIYLGLRFHEKAVGCQRQS
jgi:hypothetical protein